MCVCERERVCARPVAVQPRAGLEASACQAVVLISLPRPATCLISTSEALPLLHCRVAWATGRAPRHHIPEGPQQLYGDTSWWARAEHGTETSTIQTPSCLQALRRHRCGAEQYIEAYGRGADARMSMWDPKLDRRRMPFVVLGKSFSSGVGARKSTRRLCSSAHQRPQRPRLLDMIPRKAPPSTAIASDSPTTMRSLRLYWRSARRNRTSGNCRRRLAESVSPSCGTSRKGTGWKRPTPASCGW